MIQHMFFVSSKTKIHWIGINQKTLFDYFLRMQIKLQCFLMCSKHLFHFVFFQQMNCLPFRMKNGKFKGKMIMIIDFYM